MHKQLQFKGRDESGNIFCQPLLGGDMEKTAAVAPGSKLHPKIKEFVRAFRPTKHGIYVLVNAMGASEFWSSNVNGDNFPEKALIHAPEGWNEMTPEEMKAAAKTWDYGFPTFMNAAPYKHHSNKDRSRAFGSVELAVWNPEMHRVELIVYLDRALCKKFGAYDVIERIENGEFPDVSMGCFLAGTPVTYHDGTRLPIERIQKGMEVLTHTGKVRTVTETHRRAYQGLIYSIRAEAHRVIRATRQHQFLVVPESQVKHRDDRGNLVWREGIKLSPEWVHAECLDTEHYLLEPIPDTSGTSCSYDSDKEVAMMRLLGYYLAEGHTLRSKQGNLCGIELTTNVDDPVHDEIEHLCEVIGTKNKPVTFQRHNSKQALGISIFDESLAIECSIQCGHYSHEKRLSSTLLLHSANSLFHFLGAYANGDGCGPEDGSLKFSTCNEQLAIQVQRMLLRLGVISSLGQLEHGPSPLVDKDTTEFVVHVGKQWSQQFRPYTSKVKPVEVVKSKYSRRIIDGYLVTPIREIDAVYAETEVFNFEVEEDNSYLVEGLAVHNCKVPYDVCTICAHKSKTRADYCTCVNGVKHRMNQILPDGRKVAVINDFPRFFDISFVFIGADKTAKVMAKLAQVGNQVCLGEFCTIPHSSAEVADTFSPFYSPPAGMEKKACSTIKGNCGCPCPKMGTPECCIAGVEKMGAALFGANATAKMASHRKLSEITKSIPAGPFTEETLPRLEGSEKDIPNDLLDLMGELGLGSALSTSGLMGMVMKPREFQRVLLVQIGEKPLADKLDKKNEVFKPSDESDESIPIDKGFMHGGLKDLLMSLMGDRSIAAPALKKRSIKITIIARKSPVDKNTSDEPVLKKIAAAYNGYRASLVKKAELIADTLVSDPQLRSSIYGRSPVEAFAGGFGKTASANVLSPESFAYLVGAYRNPAEELSKTAYAALARMGALEASVT